MQPISIFYEVPFYCLFCISWNQEIGFQIIEHMPFCDIKKLIYWYQTIILY